MRVLQGKCQSQKCHPVRKSCLEMSMTTMQTPSSFGSNRDWIVDPRVARIIAQAETQWGANVTEQVKEPSGDDIDLVEVKQGADGWMVIGSSRSTVMKRKLRRWLSRAGISLRS